MAFPATTGQASLTVFGIPELAHLICPMIRRRDSVSLMRVCRQLFYSIIPFVWEEVDEANVLMSLIPGGGVVVCDSEVPVLPYMVMQLPDSLDLSRFNIYAPHVKRLTPSVSCVDEYDGWEGFLACTRSIDLLPNLKTLYLPIPEHTMTTDSDTMEVDSMNWVTVFLSSSLQTLVLAPSVTIGCDSGWLDFGLTNNLMRSILWKCPGLRSLSMLPGKITFKGARSLWGEYPSQRVSFRYDSSEIHSSLGHLSNLSSLLISSVVLNSENLTALSRLPRLESLCVTGYARDRETYCNNLQIPVDLEIFPALKKLELNQLTWDTIANLCNIKNLVAKLHSMTISDPNSNSASNNGLAHERDTGLSDIISLLVASSSTINTLVLRNIRDVPIEPPCSWGRLSLKTLHLGWRVVRSYGFGRLQSILSSLPRLEDLRLSMADTPIELRQIREVIELLPCLRLIQVPVKWGSVVDLKAMDFKPCRSTSDTVLCLMSDFYIPESRQEYAEQLARYLSIPRPSARIVCESHQPGLYRYDFERLYVDEEFKNMINLGLSALRLNNPGTLSFVADRFSTVFIRESVSAG